MPKARRHFIQVTTVALLWLSTSPISTMVRGGRVDQPSEIRRLLFKIFTSLSAPRALGRSYLELHPAEADIHFLTKAVFGNSAIVDAKEAARRLQQRCAFDFQNDDIVILNGWILARSEVRTCALISLV